MNPDDIHVFRIPISITTDEDNTWNVIRIHFFGCVMKKRRLSYNLYSWRDFNFYKNDYPVVADKLNQLNYLCDDYDFMLFAT